jgi:hypothetical protein
MREKYREISSAVGDGRRIRPALPASAASASALDTEAAGSDTEVFGKNVAASGAEA